MCSSLCRHVARNAAPKSRMRLFLSEFNLKLLSSSKSSTIMLYSRKVESCQLCQLREALAKKIYTMVPNIVVAVLKANYDYQELEARNFDIKTEWHTLEVSYLSRRMVRVEMFRSRSALSTAASESPIHLLFKSATAVPRHKTYFDQLKSTISSKHTHSRRTSLIFVQFSKLNEFFLQIIWASF